MDYSPIGFSVLSIFQARILEWISVSFFMGPSWPRDRTHVSCTGRWIFYLWTTWEVPEMGIYSQNNSCIYSLFPYLFGAAPSELLRGCFPNFSPQFSLNKTLFYSYYRLFIDCLCKQPELSLSPLELKVCFDLVFSFMFYSPWGHKKSDITNTFPCLDVTT